MSRQLYTEEFKIEAVKQVTERDHPVTEVAALLGVPGYYATWFCSTSFVFDSASSRL